MGLHEQRKTLKDDVAKEQSALDAAKADLERTIREKQVEIKDLKVQLRSDIASLENSISASKKRVSEQKRVNEEVMLSSQDKFRANIAEKSRQIEDLTAAKKRLASRTRRAEKSSWGSCHRWCCV